MEGEAHNYRDIKNLTMASSNHKRLRPDSDDDELNAQQFTSQQNANVARFLIVKSEEKDRKVSDLSPFAIEKSIQAIAGHPKSIKRLKSGGLLLEFEKKSHITNLLSTKNLFNLNVKISLHGSLNTSNGVIRCQDLGPCTDDEILENLKSEGVILMYKKRTNTYILTFNTPTLPKKIKAAYLSVNVEVYIPNPLRCYNCQVFGHHEDSCLKKPICGNCGREKHCSDVRNCSETPKFANCNGNHPDSPRDCPSWKNEKQILIVKYQRSITFLKQEKSLKSKYPLQAKVTPASRRVLVLNAPILKHKATKHTTYS